MKTGNKFQEQESQKFYDHYFDTADYEVFRHDVGSFCTRSIIIKQIKHHYGSLLEIGTGISTMLEDLPQFQRFGIDISENTVAQVRNHFEKTGIDAQVTVANAESLPFDSNSFDVIISAHTFEHIKDDAKAFQECARILKPGGELIIFVPGRIDGTATPSEWEKLGHYRSYNKKRFMDLAKAEPSLQMRSLLYPHKIHNLLWNRCKHAVRWLNYPIKKWIMRDNKTYEIRPFYQKALMPALVGTLDYLDRFTMEQEKNLLGTEFNVLACFEKRSR